MQILYDESLEEPPPADRLRAMIRALASGTEIDAALRTEIIDALKRHEVRRANDESRSKRGGSIAYATWYAAAIAKELVDKHGAKVKAAVYAAADSVMWKKPNPPVESIASVTKYYQKLNSSADGFITMRTKEGSISKVSVKFCVSFISPDVMDYAVTKLKGHTNLNAPAHNFICAMTVLTDPTEEKGD